MWGGCGLFQELQAMGETPERWGCSQKTNCSSFSVSIARVRAGRRMIPLENITLDKQRHWNTRKKEGAGAGFQEVAFEEGEGHLLHLTKEIVQKQNCACYGAVSLWFPIALLSAWKHSPWVGSSGVHGRGRWNVAVPQFPCPKQWFRTANNPFALC